jgi:hypothetical protein
MARKQASGFQNRKKAAARRAALEAQGILMPRFDIAIDDVSSLTALTSLRLKGTTEWLKKRLSSDDYVLLLRALSEFRADAIARIQERQLVADEQALRLVEQHEARVAGTQHGTQLSALPAPAAPDGKIVPREPAAVGELMPRERPDEEGN